MKAKVYGSSHCVWCDRVAKLLEDSGIEIEKIDVSQGKAFIKEMQEAAGEKVNTVLPKFISLMNLYYVH